MKQKKPHHKNELPSCLKKLGIVLPQANKTKGICKDKTQTLGKDKGLSTYREDFKDFSDLKLKAVRWHQFDVQNINADRGLTDQELQPSSPLTTTFRSSYKGEHGAPALSCRPKWSSQPPHRPGPSGYSIDFAAKHLKKRSPPPTRRGNVLDTYPRNVLIPYTRPEQIVTVWKPFPILPPVKNGLKTSDLLDLLSKDSFSSTYRQDYVR